MAKLHLPIFLKDRFYIQIYMIKEIFLVGENNMEKGRVIELENGQKYAVAEIIDLNDNRYIYVVNLDDNKDIRFATLENNKINFINDDNLYGLLMIEVAKKQNKQ